jgi:hypothetical protein
VKEVSHVPTKVNITGFLSLSDVESLEEITGGDWNGETAVYAFNSCILFSYPYFLAIASYCQRLS